ncbi:MAG TPA: sugar transferase [Chitinophagales bacterium]|nr:sugar transferase [Chitinophagales bacterium]
MKEPVKQKGIVPYVVLDYLVAVMSWALFFTVRKLCIDHYPSSQFPEFLNDAKFIQGIIVIPLGWLLMYYVTGTYTNIYLKSRVGEITRTFFVTAAGVILLFFTVLIDDQVQGYRDYYSSVVILFVIHLLLTTLGRLIVLNAAKRRMEKGIIYFPTLFIGGNKRAIEVYNEINGKARSQGYHFIGFIDTNGNGNGLSTRLPKLGALNKLEEIIRTQCVKQVIVAIESSEHHQLKEILNQLADRNVIIKIVPDMYDILAGSVRMNHLLGASFIEIYPQLMPEWQCIIKRMADIVISVVMLIILLPVYLFVAIKVKLSSPGSIIYSQERIGIHGKPFKIYKFRSMFTNAETNGPLLSSHEDQRITSWGKVMRKWRLDELPQFLNVLKGEMSIVGPRPERKYYIDQILQQTTDYKHLHRVQPGITSLGMVKFGYAENLNQMISRMKYDLLYIENMSLMLDLRVLLYTFRTILQGRGK